MSTTVTPAATDVRTRKYRSVNPATGEVVEEYTKLTDEEAEQKLARAHQAFLSWRETTVEERVALFRRFVQVVQDNSEELARLSTLEMGKPIGQSRMEVGMVVDIFSYLAEAAPSLLADVETPAGASTIITRREPLGVTLGIEPWNVPLYQAARAAAPNLMVGNTIVLKPSEVTPGSTFLLEKMFQEAGFPEDVFQTVLISTDQVSTYIEDDRIRAVTLTGSDRAGSAVGEQASRNIKPVVLELGGSDAFIVLDGADARKAASDGCTARLFLGGQVCASPKRMIVTEAVADEYIAAFVEGFAGQVVGDPFDEATTVGPLSSAAQADLLQAQYQDAIDKGATVLVEGGRVDGPGAYFRPAVITDITPEMRVYSEEAFGPLAMIYRVKDADEAVELANSSKYGLNGTVFSEDVDEALAVARRLDTGAVGINGWMGAPAAVPFGGTKRSGVGRELGPVGMEAFSNIKSYGVPPRG